MKQTASFLIIFFILFLFPAQAQSTYEFLRLDMSARAGALGGTFVSNHDDANVMFYNPAGLSRLTGNPVSFSFLKFLMDINHASLAYSTEFEDIGRFGAAVRYANYGTFVSADESGMKDGEFGAGEAAFIVGYSNSLDDNFYYGANVKFIYSGIADRSSSALGLDVGLHYYLPSGDLSIGFSVMNVGGQLSSYYTTREELPLDVALGVSKKLEHLPLRLSLDFRKLNEDADNFTGRFKAFSIGAEFTLSKVLRLRLGYDNEKRNELKIGSFAGIAGFNAGLGASISDYQFDYGYSSWGEVGALHRISVSTVL